MTIIIYYPQNSHKGCNYVNNLVNRQDKSRMNY